MYIVTIVSMFQQFIFFSEFVFDRVKSQNFLLNLQSYIFPVYFVKSLKLISLNCIKISFLFIFAIFNKNDCCIKEWKEFI